MNGGWYFRRRFGIKPLGWRRSGLLDAICNMLLLDLRRSSSLGGGGGREEELEFRRTSSFAMGGGGLSESGSGVSPDSSSCGSSGAPRVYQRKSSNLYHLLRTMYARPLQSPPTALRWIPN